MSAMTQEDRIRNLERRLEVLEGLYMELVTNNAHLLVGGASWAAQDRKAIETVRHD